MAPGPACVTLHRPRPGDGPARDAALLRHPVGPRATAPDDHRIRVDGALAGMVGTTGQALTIRIDPAFQGRGVATRAAVLALSRAFVAGARRITASHDPADHRAALLLARLGFRPLRRQARTNGAAAVRLTLTPADFAARHSLVVKTPRLVIDALRPADLIALHAIVTRQQVARMLFLFRPDMPVAAMAPIFPVEALVPPFRLVARRGGSMVGSIGIGPGAVPDIFYFLDPAHAGAGLGAEMVAGFADEVMLRYGFDALTARVFHDNPASRRVLEKAGFRVVADRMLTSAARPTPEPGWLFRRDAR